MSDQDFRQSREFIAPYVRIRGRVSRRGEVRWSPCLRTEKGREIIDERASRFARPAMISQPIRYMIAFLDYRDQPLALEPLFPASIPSDQEWASFVLRTAYRENVHAIQLRYNERPMGTLKVPTCRPYFTLLRPQNENFIDPAGVLHLHWADHDSEQPLTYFVRYSHNGRNWFRPGVNLRTNDYYLDLREMPGGSHCVVQVLATNGYRTSFVQTRHFDVEVKPLEVLFGPSEGPILFAQGFSRENGPLVGEQIIWLDSDNREVRRGGSLDVRSLAPGNHRLSVRVEDPHGATRTLFISEYDQSTGKLVAPPGE